jgi:diguanylate cyclase (GGDEF)-like protein
MGAELCFAAILSDGGDELVANYGGPNGLAGPEAFTRTPRSLTDFTMSSDVPVLIRDLRRETRFAPPEPLLARGAVSGLTVPIGTREEPLGMLGAFTTRQRSFSVDETHFLHAVANVLADAIKHRRAEEAHRHAAVHDALTGLPNRTLALDRIDHALHGIEREDLTVAVIVLDLDRFKVINDSLGHAAGDRLLLAIAPRLLDAVRPSDTVARLGGDEFVIVCEHLAGAREAIVLAERIEAAVARPLTLDSGEHHVSASIGIAVATDGRETPQSMLRDADAAMYRAKAGGRGRVELFDDRMREQVLGRLRMETELRRAIDRGDLRVHYQPIVDLESRRPVSVEALVRWERPNGRLMPPDMFIPVAEETGLIFDVGLWVLREACRQVSAWQRAYDDPLGLGVNASGRQIHDPVFPQEVSGIARHYELAPGTLGLEVTESVLIEDAESPVTVLARLREDGLRISLDDFGTGYSSLSYLKRLPLDALKVDRSFVKGLDSSPDDAAIIEAVVKLAQTLGLDVVAEGVETDQQAELLRRLSCRKAQGFLFTPPLPADEFRHYLDAHYASYTP